MLQKKRKQTYKNNPEITKNAINKSISTKRKNNTFSTSKQEEQLYLLLNSKYLNTIRQHKDDSRYPFCCAFISLQKIYLSNFNLVELTEENHLLKMTLSAKIS